MKRLLTLSLILISLSINGQTIKGYITEKVTFDHYDSLYVTNNVSGVMFTFDKLDSDSTDIEYLKIGEITKWGIIYSTYKIIEKSFGPTDNKYVSYGTMNVFGDKLLFQYYPKEPRTFILVFEHTQCPHNKTGIYESIYRGEFLK